MLKPLKNFICDCCGGIINDPEEGYVEFYRIRNENDIYIHHEFRIVHHAPHSPNYINGGHCYTHEEKMGRGDLSLKDFINSPNRVAEILSFVDIGEIHDPMFRPYSKVADVRGFVEFVRRVAIPYYEEARLYLKQANQEGFIGDQNEISIYSESVLKSIIENYNTD